MKWITEIKLPCKRTNKEALESALELISDWCEENGYKYEIEHNYIDRFHTKRNRVLFISNERKTYGYQLVISTMKELLGYKEYKGITGKMMKTEIISDYSLYYAHLTRVY